jgi:hypothetical protein
MATLRVALVSSGTTLGQAINDVEFESVLTDAGADAVRVLPAFPRLPERIKQPQVNDVVEAWWLRRALTRHLRRHPVDAVVFATTTATFFQPRSVLRRSALRFDALACENRRGRFGLISRVLEQRALHHVRVFLPMSSNRSLPLPRDRYLAQAETVIAMPPVLPPDRVPDRPREHGRVFCYASNPEKKGLDVMIRAWQAHARADARLFVAGISASAAEAYLSSKGLSTPSDVAFLDRIPHAEFVEQLCRAEIYLAASRHEEYGMAQLEALYFGALLVSAESAGLFEAAGLLTALDPRLLASGVDDRTLAVSLDHALSLSAAERAVLADRTKELLEPYQRQSQLDAVGEHLLPALRRLAGLNDPNASEGA